MVFVFYILIIFTILYLFKTMEVEEIAEKATKEAKHEDTLKALEATWSGVSFTMNFYKDTDVPLLKMDDLSVELLESDQMAVQSIVGSRYAYFRYTSMFIFVSVYCHV